MAKRYATLTPQHTDFIAQQQIFFVASAGCEGRVNLSPKGMDSLRVIDDSTVRWLNLTGSGNETAAHVLENGRMTIMFCAFEGRPLILRLYGEARVAHPRDSHWDDWSTGFPTLPGTRQIFELRIDLVQTSCGMGVPLYDYQDDRELLTDWARKQGTKGIEEYWTEKNRLSLDGKPAKI